MFSMAMSTSSCLVFENAGQSWSPRISQAMKSAHRNKKESTWFSFPNLSAWYRGDVGDTGTVLARLQCRDSSEPYASTGRDAARRERSHGSGDR